MIKIANYLYYLKRYLKLFIFLLVIIVSLIFLLVVQNTVNINILYQLNFKSIYKFVLILFQNFYYIILPISYMGATLIFILLNKMHNEYLFFNIFGLSFKFVLNILIGIHIFFFIFQLLFVLNNPKTSSFGVNYKYIVSDKIITLTNIKDGEILNINNKYFCIKKKGRINNYCYNYVVFNFMNRFLDEVIFIDSAVLNEKEIVFTNAYIYQLSSSQNSIIQYDRFYIKNYSITISIIEDTLKSKFFSNNINSVSINSLIALAFINSDSRQVYLSQLFFLLKLLIFPLLIVLINKIDIIISTNLFSIFMLTFFGFILFQYSLLLFLKNLVYDLNILALSLILLLDILSFCLTINKINRIIRNV